MRKKYGLEADFPNSSQKFLMINFFCLCAVIFTHLSFTFLFSR